MRLLAKLIVLAAVFVNGLKASAAHNIPTIYMQTADGEMITSRDVWKQNTVFKLVQLDGTVSYESAAVAVKSRGHSTFTKPKKPYTFKLPKAESLLGMKPGRKWILLANFMDHSNARNSLALDIARQTGLDWTPSWRFVDVVVNGKPQGCYTLVESIEVEPNRLALNHERGFLVECDDYGDELTFHTERHKLPLHIKFPKKTTAEKDSEVVARFNNIECLLYSGNDADLSTVCNKLIDRDSFIDWWLVHELAQNAEPNGPRSCYFHDRGDGVLRMGPVWDFDLAFITVGLDDGGDIRPSRFNLPDVKLLTGDSLYNADALWFGRLFKDASFRARTVQRWNELKPRFEALAGEIDKWKKELEPSAADNDGLWKGQDPAKFDTFATSGESIDNLKKVYLYRIKALDKILNSWK